MKGDDRLGLREARSFIERQEVFTRHILGRRTDVGIHGGWGAVGRRHGVTRRPFCGSFQQGVYMLGGNNLLNGSGQPRHDNQMQCEFQNSTGLEKGHKKRDILAKFCLLSRPL